MPAIFHQQHVGQTRKFLLVFGFQFFELTSAYVSVHLFPAAHSEEGILLLASSLTVNSSQRLNAS